MIIREMHLQRNTAGVHFSTVGLSASLKNFISTLLTINWRYRNGPDFRSRVIGWIYKALNKQMIDSLSRTESIMQK